jgi:FAD/FMN-containing dehydrogenase
MEAEPAHPRAHRLGLHKVIHAYGTNGIITEVEMPLAPAYDWVDVIVGFDDFMDAAALSPTSLASRRHGCSRNSPWSRRRSP